ncbi:AraC family transcriptional regulator [Tabrizicola sp.]|uniref:AraC family transcriptional regulator n=1 Tax=Tabrizicola sp. TaxID=2005166 RepID=UPI00273248E4|nr:AraC family transcriptional regulator [Tabrizicola sp.]MDP3196913.1 AraC family transcriptional regulator [Tabrizicola sp.]
MEAAGIGRVLFWEGGSLWLALVTGTMGWHEHHAIQLCLPIRGTAQFKTDPEGEWITCEGAVIAPDVPHVFHAPGSVVANILFEPESFVGRAVLARFGNTGLHLLSGSEAKALAQPIGQAYFAGADDASMIALARQAVTRFSGVDAPRDVADVRVLRTISEIRAHLDEPVTLPALARKIGLSPGRLRHLFVAETGVSFRRYLLWERLNLALSLGFGGTSWTEAAYAANFADSAHLSRTCQRMFGLAPTRARIESPQAHGSLTA